MQTKVNLNHYEGKFKVNNRLKSHIQMDKHKLVSIIVKDLEELKILSEEAANSQNNSSLIIDLAVNKARLLIQEIELLRELAVNSVSLQEETDEEDRFEEEVDEVSEVGFPDPELEILHFEDRDYSETEEFQEDEEEFVEQDEDESDEDLEENESDEDEGEDLDEVEESESDEDEPETDEDDLTETEVEEEEEENVDPKEEEEFEEEDEEDDEEEEFIEEEPVQKPVIEQTELKNDPQPGIREISIEELDDEDELEPVRFTPQSETQARPQMREIPKPENTAPEKTVVGESFQKERSLNDSIGENKQEPKVANSPITSLRAAIGLNDRFIFIREIFDNNSDKYNKIIENLDKMEHIQEAVEYLKANLSMQKNEASLKFVDLLKRRFTK